MAAKKRRNVWRISDIVRAICKERGWEPTFEHNGDPDGAYVLEMCAVSKGDAGMVIGKSRYSLPVLLDLPPRPTTTPAEIAAALVATARRLRVPMVDA